MGKSDSKSYVDLVDLGQAALLANGLLGGENGDGIVAIEEVSHILGLDFVAIDGQKSNLGVLLQAQISSLSHSATGVV